MSNYRAAAYHPEKKMIYTATWLDHYFGYHRYGVWFPDDPEDKVFLPSEVNIPLDTYWILLSQKEK